MRNQSDIAAAIRPYYHAAASRRLRSLLRDHILDAVALLRPPRQVTTPR